jgi:hypothetical protein
MKYLYKTPRDLDHDYRSPSDWGLFVNIRLNICKITPDEDPTFETNPLSRAGAAARTWPAASGRRRGRARRRRRPAPAQATGWPPRSRGGAEAWGTLVDLSGAAVAAAFALGWLQLAACEEGLGNSLGWTTKTANARKPAPRRKRRWPAGDWETGSRRAQLLELLEPGGRRRHGDSR